jgi:1,2-diacylglycerol 3-beta-glucosyltransferase
MGVIVLTRKDNEKQGKGFALEWAFFHLLKEDYDAFVVLDADCSIDPHALTVFNSYINRGSAVLQANDVTSNPDESATSYLLAVGNLLENNFFYAPKSRIGLSVFLRGTGMVFHRNILEKYPWNAYTVSEDTDYTLRLLRNNIRIIFINNVNVRSAFPATNEQLQIQRNRWVHGNIKLSKSNTLRLMAKGISSSNLLLIDGGWTLLVLSRPFVLIVIVLSLILTIFLMLMAPGNISIGLFDWMIILIIGLGIYFGLGVIKLGLDSRRSRFLLQSPLLILRLTKILLAGLLGKMKLTWERTPR